MMSEERDIFLKHLQKAGLKRTGQRDLILEVFLDTEEHVSSERLYDLVREKDPHVGYTTVYRTLKLLTDCGLAREVRFGDGRAHYEHNYKHEHHDHLICTACGQIVEFFSPEMEALQDDIAASHGFVVTQHSMRLFGLCAECRKKSQSQNLASAAQPRVRPAVARAS